MSGASNTDGIRRRLVTKTSSASTPAPKALSTPRYSHSRVSPLKKLLAALFLWPLLLFAKAYELIIWLFLRIDDEKPSAELLERIAATKDYEQFDLDGKGLLMTKPSEGQVTWFVLNKLPYIARDMIKATFVGIHNILFSSTPVIRFDDEHMEFMINGTFMGRLMVPTENKDELVIDLRHMGELETLPGFYAPAIQAFCRADAKGRYSIQRIIISGDTVTRKSENWALANWHLLVSMTNETLFAEHSTVHINNGYQESTMVRTLSVDNPCRLFMQSHFGFGFALNKFITDLLYKHTSPGNCFHFPVESVYTLIRKGMKADHERPLIPIWANTEFNRAMSESVEVCAAHVSDFVDRNLNDVNSAHFGEVRAWADAMHRIMPEFPTGASLDIPLTKKMLTRVFYDCTFNTDCDHISITDAIKWNGLSNRIRVPWNATKSWKLSDGISLIDTYQRVVFATAFSGDTVEQDIRSVQYDPSLSLHETQYKDSLDKLAAKYPNMFSPNRISAYINI